MRRNKDDLIVNDENKVIIRCRLCVIAHAGGNSGHLGYQASAQKLTQFFYWKNFIEDMKIICKACLHCLPTRGGARVARPLGTQVHERGRAKFYIWTGSMYGL